MVDGYNFMRFASSSEVKTSSSISSEALSAFAMILIMSVNAPIFDNLERRIFGVC